MTVLRRLSFAASDMDDAAPADCFNSFPVRRWNQAPGVNGTGMGLGRAIDKEVIPRLLAAHRSRQEQATASGFNGRTRNGDDVAEFTRILLANDLAEAAAFIEALLGRRVPLEAIYLDLMTPAAQRLGDLWIADLCHFTEVTAALGGLQHLLRDFSGATFVGGAGCDFGRRALLVSAPGEQHSFGALMVAEFLRRAGWDVTGELGASGSKVVATVRDEWFALVGLSVSAEQHVGAVTSIIRRIRSSSRNAAIVVMVGGNVFLEHPGLVALVGADATAVDAREAVAQAENVIAEIPSLTLASSRG